MEQSEKIFHYPHNVNLSSAKTSYIWSLQKTVSDHKQLFQPPSRRSNAGTNIRVGQRPTAEGMKAQINFFRL